MTLDELKEAAVKILAIAPAEGFRHETFSCGSGGAPRNKAGVPEVHRDQSYAYGTTANGPAYAGSVTVECRPTGVVDADDRPVYATPEGVVFVYKYCRGAPEYFDSGQLQPPRFSLPR